MLDDEKFNTAITYGPNDARKVKFRFGVWQQRLFGRFWVITGIDLKHFKCFDLLKLPLRPLTLLSGANASGKSSVLQALLLLHQTITEHEWSDRLLLNGGAIRLGTVADVVDQRARRSCQIALRTDERRDSMGVRRGARRHVDGGHCAYGPS